MIVNRKKTLDSLRKQTRIQDLIEHDFSDALRPLVAPLDQDLNAIYSKTPLDIYSMDKLFHSEGGFNEKAKDRLFPLAEGLERSIRWDFTDNYEFESDAIEFFQSATAQSLSTFSKWFIAYASRQYIEGRSFELRNKGYYYYAGQRVYFSYAKKRVGGETRKKLWKAKAQGKAKVAFNADKIFSEELAKVLKSKGDNLIKADDYLVSAPQGNTYKILGKSPEQAAKQPSYLIVDTDEGVYGLETMEGF